MRTMEIINDTQTNILSLLARFKFLVISQIVPLLDKSIGYVRIQLAKLAKTGYIKSMQLNRPGKAENMYYLTESGKELILQHAKVFDDDIKLPIGVPLVVKDYSHRKSMISLTIVLYYHFAGLGITVKESISYFDKQGDNRKLGNLKARTKLPLGNGFFIPDGIMITDNGEEQTVWLVEMYCDNSSTRVISQILTKHLVCIAEGSTAAKFGIQANPFVLSCFANSGVKNKVIERLATNEMFKPFQHLFFFASLEEIQRDSKAWQTINGNKIVYT